MRVLGVDPGLAGGLAVLDGAGALVAVRRTPLKRKDLADGTKRQIVDARGVATFIRENAVTHAIIEEVNGFGMGATSAFSFGRDSGAIFGVCAALDLDPLGVTPQKWKGALGLLLPRKRHIRDREHKAALKAAAIARAQRMFPGVVELGHDGCAEAALIAAWWLISRNTDHTDRAA